MAPAVSAAGANQGSSVDEEPILRTDFVPLSQLRSTSSDPPELAVYVPSTFTDLRTNGTVLAQTGSTQYSIASAGVSGIYTFFFQYSSTALRPVFVSASSGSSVYLNNYNYSGGTSIGSSSITSVDDTTGLYYLSSNSASMSVSTAYFDTVTIPVYPTLADGLAAVADVVSNAGSAVLISAGTSYEWCTGYSLTNSGSSDIAGGWYNDKFYVATYTPNYRITNSTVSVNFSLYDNATGLYYSMVQLIGDTSDEIGPLFDSADAFFASAVEVLDDSSGGGGYGSDVDGVPGTFDLPAGYVGYLHLYDPTVDVTLTTTMNRYSSIGGGWNANQTYKSGTTLPYGSRQFPSSGSSVIQWYKDASGQTNLLGQTKAARRSFTASSNLIEIYNPYYQDAGGNSEDGNTSQATINNTIHGSTVGIMSWVIYPVEDNMSASNFSGIDSTLPDGSTGNPAINDGNNNWTSFEDSEGNQYIPPEGGLNAPVGGSSITDILNNFFTRFFGLFTEGHDAIRNLTQQASEFVSHLSELYSWLPPQVLSVLTSAIILAIIIGVLKVFL